MVIPFDDHMVHRGHGIFDTAAIIEGKIYDLENHLDRFIRLSGGFEARTPEPRGDARDRHPNERALGPPRGVDPLLGLFRHRATWGSSPQGTPSPPFS